MIDRRLFFSIDWVLAGVTLVLSAIGVAMILSATQSGRASGLYVKQLYLVGIGIVALLLSLLVDYRRLSDRAVLFYILAVLDLASRRILLSGRRPPANCGGTLPRSRFPNRGTEVRGPSGGTRTCRASRRRR